MCPRFMTLLHVPKCILTLSNEHLALRFWIELECRKYFVWRNFVRTMFITRNVFNNFEKLNYLKTLQYYM